MASSGTPWPGLIMVGVVGVGVAGIAYAAYLAEKKRNAAMQTVAQNMGFSYEEKPDQASVEAVVLGLPLFGVGHSRKVLRLLKGKLADRDAAIIDYRYTTGSGKNSHTHTQTVALFTRGATGLPDFQLAPEGFLHGLAEMFGAQDIDFEQSAEFSKRYLLKGPDEAAIRRAFTIDTLAYFAGAPGWRVQANGGRLLAYQGEKYVEPAQIPAFAAEALRIAGLFKT